MPWFNTDGCPLIQKPYIFVDGSPVEGGQKIRCRLWINVCGTIIERVKMVDARGGQCWNRQEMDDPNVCCTAWGTYKSSPTSNYNPAVDADGDGIPNDQDDNPLGPNRSGGGNSNHR